MLWIAPFFLAALAPGVQAPPAGIEVVIYFDRDSATLSSSDLEILNSTVGLLRSGSGEVRVEGHTSTLGDDAYNVSLAQRRALVVSRALVARGVANERITMAALGESAPARPTADGVDEPLNDRVAIHLQRPAGPAGE